MNRTMSGSVRAGGDRPITGGTEDAEDGTKQPKSRPGPELLSLSRCAGCYNQKASSMPRQGGDSSSSAEDSGPEPESESESESESTSSSSSSCSRPVVAETPAIPAPAPPGGRSSSAEAEGDRAKVEDVEEEEEEDKNEKRRRTMIRRAPLVKSFSLPPSLTPPLRSRPPRIVSTLHLEVLPGKRSHDASFSICRHLPEREEKKPPAAAAAAAGGGRGGGGGGGASQSQWMWLPWQQGSRPPSQPQQHQYLQYQNQYQYQQQQHPPPYPLPALHPPTQTHTHLYTLNPQLCWHCYRLRPPLHLLEPVQPGTVSQITTSLRNTQRPRSLSRCTKKKV